MRKLKAALSVR